VGFLQASVTLTPVATHVGAIIRINGTELASGSAWAALELAEGLNTVGVEVTAEDGVAKQEYVVSIMREYADSFVQQAYLKANKGFITACGSRVSISGDALVVGAPSRETSWGEYRTFGAACIFTRSDGVWSQQPYFRASNAEAGDGFGRSVSISGNTLVVGAPGEDSSANGGEADKFSN
jgi:hypothetical protein